MSRWDVIKWWEFRRVPYTILVSAAGCGSYFVTNNIVAHHANSGEEFLNPATLLIGVPLAVVVANVCYTFGWIIELGQKGDQIGNHRQRIFYGGLVFSIVVISAPIWPALLTWLRN